jgi:D-tyrosyl-tRNA(Tyr) deacylase
MFPTLDYNSGKNSIRGGVLMKNSPDRGIGATPSMVRPAELPIFALRGVLGWQRNGILPHRPVKTVSHAAGPDVAYHSVACIDKGPGGVKNKGHEREMIGLLQRVTRADVTVRGRTIGKIDRGLMVLVAVHRDDTDQDVARLAERLLGYRVFPDDEGRMNLSVRDVDGGLLLIPQFTLTADTKKGTRASFTKGASPDKAAEYFEALVAACRQALTTVETGEFGADMQVSLTNDGPVTFWLSTQQ